MKKLSTLLPADYGLNGKPEANLKEALTGFFRPSTSQLRALCKCPSVGAHTGYWGVSIFTADVNGLP